MPVLEVRGLSTHFRGDGGVARAVDGMSFTLDRGETLAIVGESGCGKSITALSILRLVPDPPGRIVAGQVLLDGRDLLSLNERAMRTVRGNDIAMIFQEPMTSLNPVFTVGDQIVEAIREHRLVGARAARSQAIEALARVGVPDPGRRVDSYPHELSGGMRQRVMIAMALACEPKVLIADEPTTALDVTIQAQVLDLIQEIKDELGMGVILITHDLGVVAETAARVVVMYAGRKVEEAPVAALFTDPRHPYTQGLLASTPRPDGAGAGGRLREIPGMVPSLFDMPAGCAFAPRCPLAFDRCHAEQPALRDLGNGRSVACFLAEGTAS